MLDDDVLLTENTIVHLPGGLWRIWFSTEPIDYWPVSNTGFWLEWHLWGERPTPYRIANLAIHIVNALLVWLVLRRLRVPGAYLAALFFAIHPANVETVAWIAQQRTALSLFLALLSAYWYLIASGSTRIS